MKKAVIFGSSAPVEGDSEYNEAYEIGKLLGSMGYDVVSGGYMGTMEAASKGAKESNANAIGVTTKVLNYADPNKWLDEQIHTEDMFERIKTMMNLGDIFIVLKGSTGTMHEFMAIWDHMSIKLIDKKPVICFGDHWKPVVEKVSETERAKEADLIRNGIVRFAENREELKTILEELN